MNYKTAIECLLPLMLLGVSFGQRPPAVSPCPELFQYVLENGKWKGLVSIEPPLTFQSISIIVNMTTDFNPQQVGVGAVEVKGGAHVIQEISDSAHFHERQIVNFVISFPLNQPVPKVYSIVINDHEFCSADLAKRYRGLISLQYTLRTGLTDAPDVHGNQFIPAALRGTPGSQPEQQFIEESNTREPNFSTRTSTTFPQPFQFTRTSTTFPQPFQFTRTSTTSPRPFQFTRTSTTSPQPFQFTRTSTTSPQPEIVEQDHQDSFISKCGLTKSRDKNRITDRIINGMKTSVTNFPWHAAIYKPLVKGGSRIYTCGGSLISERHIVTCARCVITESDDDASLISIYLGIDNLDEVRESEGHEVRSVILHDDFDENQVAKDDIALAVLRTAVTYQDNVRPICLWESEKKDIEELYKKDGTVIGWGDGKELMSAKMPVHNYQVCQRQDLAFFSAFYNVDTFCAGYANGTSVCIGDSGGGMAFPIRQNDAEKSIRWFLRGLISNSPVIEVQEGHGPVCDTNKYAVFTDVVGYVDWINNIINNKY